LPCLFGFQSAGPANPGKKKGTWRRQAPCRLPAFQSWAVELPTQETPGLVTHDEEPAEGHMSLPNASAQAGGYSRRCGCFLPGRVHSRCIHSAAQLIAPLGHLSSCQIDTLDR
jgi:hypothetical protein